MGDAKRKRVAEEEHRAAQARRRAEERARWNAPRRTALRPVRVDLGGRRYELHADGSVYQAVTRVGRIEGRLIDTGQRRRVKDRALVEAVQRRAAELVRAQAGEVRAAGGRA